MPLQAGADWNFETPNMVRGTMIPSLVQMPDAMKRELYEYPSRILTVAEAERAQKLRMQAGEEIHPDKYGRIKPWFPWDRRAKKDGSDTCWVRVAQSWGGGTWGAQIIPRIGMEVMVAFVDGDPDRPLVTGVVPNPANAVPYTLPANKTKSTFRTNTHKS